MQKAQKIQTLLDKGTNIKDISEVMKMSRQAIHDYIKRYKLKRPDFVVYTRKSTRRVDK